MITPPYTKQAWDSVPQSNSVAKACALVDLKVRSVLAGRDRMLIVAGPTAVGKSYIIKQALEQAKRYWVACNPKDWKEFASILRETAQSNAALIWEEGDEAFNSQRLLNILKIATDPMARNRVYKDVQINQPIFLACNADMAKLRSAGHRYENHLTPLFRRTTPLVIPSDPLDLWEYACHLAISKGMLRRTVEDRPRSISRQIANEALDYFTRHLWHLRSVGPGVLTDIASSMVKYSNPLELDQELSKHLRPNLTGNAPPKSPTIFVKEP